MSTSMSGLLILTSISEKRFFNQVRLFLSD
jgi:hypothetical protein